MAAPEVAAANAVGEIGALAVQRVGEKPARMSRPALRPRQRMKNYASRIGIAEFSCRTYRATCASTQ